MQMNTSTGPRRTSPDPSSSERTECRKSSRPFRFLNTNRCKRDTKISTHYFFFSPLLHNRLVSHFYGHGDVCDLTGKPRQVIVKLKWVNSYPELGDEEWSTSAQVHGWVRLSCQCFPFWFTHIISLLSVRCKESESPHAVTVYMLEPQTCQYVLGVSLCFTPEWQKKENSRICLVTLWILCEGLVLCKTHLYQF